MFLPWVPTPNGPNWFVALFAFGFIGKITINTDWSKIQTGHDPNLLLDSSRVCKAIKNNKQQECWGQQSGTSHANFIYDWYQSPLFLLYLIYLVRKPLKWTFGRWQSFYIFHLKTIEKPTLGKTDKHCTFAITSIIPLYLRTQKLSTIYYSIINPTTEKCCSVPFIWAVTFSIIRLKS